MRWFAPLIFVAMTGGPLHTGGELFPDEEVFYNLSAKIKEHKKIEIIGDKKSVFMCEVFDDKAHIVAQVDDSGDYCLLEFDAKMTGYTILIKNIGFDKDKYTLNTN